MSTLKKSFKRRNRIRFWRMFSHYTQEELAFLLEIPTTTLSKWENCSQTPTVYYAIGISVALHRLLDEIFSDYRNEWIEKINQRAQELEKFKGRKKSNGNGKR